jgi:hypothetical protein
MALQAATTSAGENSVLLLLQKFYRTRFFSLSLTPEVFIPERDWGSLLKNSLGSSFGIVYARLYFNDSNVPTRFEKSSLLST